MKTSTIKQQVALMLGSVIILLTMLCLLFLDTIYLTSSVRIVFIIGAVVGGLCLMQGMTNKTIVEIDEKKIFPIKELTEQQLKVHQRNINNLNTYIKDLDEAETWLDKVSLIAIKDIKVYLYGQLGREQAMAQSLGWEVEADDNKKAWEGHRNTVVQANNAEKQEESFEDHHNKIWDKLEKETMKLNPATEDEYWYLVDGTPYTISVYDYNKLNKEDILVMITDDTRGREVRG